MKKLMVSLLLAIGFMLTGCATDGAYEVGKAVYQGGKVVVQNVPMSDEKREKLKKVDNVATTYDKARTTVREQLDGGKPSNANTLEVVEH